MPGLAVTTRFFDVFGVVPIAGRTFLRADEGPRPSAIVLGEAFWRRRFGGDPSVVGRELRLDGRSFTVIGIVPATFRFDLGELDTALWTLLNTPANSGPSGRYAHYVRAVGRMNPGVALEAARDDVAGIAAALGREMPATNQGHGVTVEPLRDGAGGPRTSSDVTLLLGVVGFVLLLCCANVANLLLARTTARARSWRCARRSARAAAGSSARC